MRLQRGQRAGQALSQDQPYPFSRYNGWERRPDLRNVAGAVMGVVLAIASSAPSLRAQHEVFRTFGHSGGLAGASVRRLMQDHAGFLWIGNGNGLYRYDNMRFEQFHEGLTTPRIAVC